MSTVIRKPKYKKINISLPEEVVTTIKNNIAEKEVSNFISEAVISKFKEIEKIKLKAELIEGYKSTRKEDFKLNKEFEGTLNDGINED